MGIPDPVHEAQRLVGQGALHRVILYDKRISSDTLGFPHQDGRIFRVMQDIDAHHRVERLVVERQAAAVESVDWYLCSGANQHIDAANGERGVGLLNEKVN